MKWVAQVFADLPVNAVATTPCGQMRLCITISFLSNYFLVFKKIGSLHFLKDQPIWFCSFQVAQIYIQFHDETNFKQKISPSTYFFSPQKLISTINNFLDVKKDNLHPTHIGSS